MTARPVVGKPTLKPDRAGVVKLPVKGAGISCPGGIAADGNGPAPRGSYRQTELLVRHETAKRQV